jgi:hypothetical protein
MAASYGWELPSGPAVVAVNIVAFGAFSLAGHLKGRKIIQ